jgi:diaminohydroxyphosphoribosylaminopyrimidine deaminase/5-amino-6-(5-phosphoribosylamino)uracil reductase
LYNQRYQKVFTGLKVASTLDGVIAGDKSSRLWITGERAREMGHFLRLEYDSILVGIGTFLLDDPTLNVRHPGLSGRTPLRVVLDPKDQIKNEKRKFKMLSDEPSKTLVVCPGTDGVVTTGDQGIMKLRLPVDKKGHFDFGGIKKALWHQGVRSLLIEGGAGIYQSALSSSAVDVIHWFLGRTSGHDGLRWSIPQDLKDQSAAGSGIMLGADRLIELSID